MMAKKKWTIPTAEAAIKRMGGRIEGDKIFPPDDIHDFRDEPGYEEYWSASRYLQEEEDYSNANNDPIVYFDLDDFLND